VLGGGFGELLESIEPLRPELLEEGLHGLEALRAHGVEAPRPVTLLGQQTSLTQHTQMLGDGLHGDVEMRGDVAGGQRSIASQPQDFDAVRLRQGANGRLGVQGWRPRNATS